MKLPKDSQLLDENTVCLFTFNNTYNDSCGNYSLYRTGGQFRTIPQFPERYALYSGARNKSDNMDSFLWGNNYTLDFVFCILNNSSSFMILQSNDYMMLGYSTTGYITINTGTSINNNAPVKWYVGNSYGELHHLAYMKENYDHYMYIDGIRVSGSVYSANHNDNEISLINDRGYCGYNGFVFNMRFSRGIRWTEDFNHPYTDVFYNLKERNNELYGLRTIQSE
jgi:hypothetical protein